MAMPLSKISHCNVIDCTYNVGGKCHTMAITVGDKSCALCDTYFRSGIKGGDLEVIGGVGACKASGCKFNMAFECRAGSIDIILHSDHADCSTYTQR